MKKLLILVLPLAIILTGCSVNADHLIGPDAVGIWDKIIMFFSYAMIWTGQHLGNNIINGLIVMTILFRVVTIPLYKMQIKSSSQMAAVQPEMNKIKAKFAGKNDPESKAKMNNEIAALYKRHGVNPLAGCLPMLVQMPLLFAFYASISNLLVYKGLELYGAQGMTQNFLMWETLANPVYLFAILAAITTYYTTVLSTIGSDQADNSMMTGMKYAMPIMILFMGITLPGALSLYWLIGNLFTIVQTLIIKRDVIKAAKDRKKMQ